MQRVGKRRAGTIGNELGDQLSTGRELDHTFPEDPKEQHVFFPASGEVTI